MDKIQTLPFNDFEELALEVFHFQASYNPLYKRYLELLDCHTENINSSDQIPFLPIQFFKTHTIQTGAWSPAVYFSSSGTTGSATSKHLLRSKDWYRQITQKGFEHFYGPIADYCVLGLLPSYLERNNSSLVFMVDHFIQLSKVSDSGFFLYEKDELLARIRKCQQNKVPVLLIGVSFALWDLAETHPIEYQEMIIMETGGMKGRRKEITRAELHRLYKQAFSIKEIHSEYGMTELLSQGYSKGNGIFAPIPSMCVLPRAITDPLSKAAYGKTAALNIIDLANLDTISFIATDDLGKVYSDGTFEVLGRLDNSDLRGCNLLIDKY